jgi:pimeloyl-ACP methyl ester carboxylesterase
MRKRLVGMLAGAAVAGTAIGVVRHRHAVQARVGADDALPLGSLHSEPLTVLADDGVHLHAEVDDADSNLTLVFAHGFALNLDSWHFQRAGYRGLVRTVFYDQRSHHRSGRSPREHCTIDQLGRDLAAVLDQVVPDGPVVLVGHSMGGMSVISLAAQRPELFGSRIIGVGLIGTTAGRLDPMHILMPLIRGRFGDNVASDVARRVVAGIGRGTPVVDVLRRYGRGASRIVTERFSFGGPVPTDYVTFVDKIISGTTFGTISDFFPAFKAYDEWARLDALTRVPLTIICGDLDRVISIGHSRKLHSLLPDSDLVECPGAGHMVTLERHEQVNAALDQLIASAQAHPVG